MVSLFADSVAKSCSRALSDSFLPVDVRSCLAVGGGDRRCLREISKTHKGDLSHLSPAFLGCFVSLDPRHKYRQDIPVWQFCRSFLPKTGGGSILPSPYTTPPLR